MIWDRLINFSRSEKWGDADKVNPMLLILMQELRTVVGHPFVIHNAYADGTGHSDASQHYKGNAVDFHIEGLDYAVAVGLIVEALENITICGIPASDLVGLGIYPHWNDKGFHLDVRGYHARWGRVNNEYVSFEEALKFI